MVHQFVREMGTKIKGCFRRNRSKGLGLNELKQSIELLEFRSLRFDRSDTQYRVYKSNGLELMSETKYKLMIRLMRAMFADPLQCITGVEIILLFSHLWSSPANTETHPFEPSLMSETYEFLRTLN